MVMDVFFCMFWYRIYQTITGYFLFGRFKATLRMSELEFLWVSFRGLPVECLLMKYKSRIGGDTLGLVDRFVGTD